MWDVNCGKKVVAAYKLHQIDTEDKMCGICGFTGYRQDQKTVIERMMKAIEHRGPDSEGSFCREKITLGFRRLSIIDLEDGQQPMESADGNLHIVFNGEIYDYKELRAELEAFGISFCLTGADCTSRASKKPHCSLTSCTASGNFIFSTLIRYSSALSSMGRRHWISSGECLGLQYGMKKSRL